MHRLAGHHAGSLELQRAALVGLDVAQAVDRDAQRVDDATHEAVTDGHGEDLAGAADLLALLDAGEVTEHDDADLAGVEVQGDAEGAVLELEELVGHGRGRPRHARDAVAGLGDDADLFLAGRVRLVVRHELLQRVPDLFGRIESSVIVGPYSLVLIDVVVVRGWAGQPASLRRASSSRLETVPSMTSSPISTRTPR